MALAQRMANLAAAKPSRSTVPVDDEGPLGTATLAELGIDKQGQALGASAYDPCALLAD